MCLKVTDQHMLLKSMFLAESEVEPAQGSPEPSAQQQLFSSQA